MRTLRPILATLALSMLAACATPREACERDAAAPYRAALKEQASNARDIARGYTVVTEYRQISRWQTCKRPDGATYPCFRRVTEPVTRRKAIDRPALIKRQDVLAAELTQLRKVATREVAQCRVLYPDDS